MPASVADSFKNERASIVLIEHPSTPHNPWEIRHRAQFCEMGSISGCQNTSSALAAA